jgi:hypothetical protein
MIANPERSSCRSFVGVTRATNLPGNSAGFVDLVRHAAGGRVAAEHDTIVERSQKDP